MMKIIILIAFLLSGCVDYTARHQERLRVEAKDYCKCHKGIAGVVFGPSKVDVKCNDGSHINAGGPLADLSWSGPEICPEQE